MKTIHSTIQGQFVDNILNRQTSSPTYASSDNNIPSNCSRRRMSFVPFPIQTEIRFLCIRKQMTGIGRIDVFSNE